MLLTSTDVLGNSGFATLVATSVIAVVVTFVAVLRGSSIPHTRKFIAGLLTLAVAIAGLGLLAGNLGLLAPAAFFALTGLIGLVTRGL